MACTIRPELAVDLGLKRKGDETYTLKY
uniref:Uncharacterized protein n=1 Tax=Anguilla anguilla TaxID=7936 RepID=A0A0E9RHX7_ANGAN